MVLWHIGLFALLHHIRRVVKYPLFECVQSESEGLCLLVVQVSHRIVHALDCLVQSLLADSVL